MVIPAVVSIYCLVDANVRAFSFLIFLDKMVLHSKAGGLTARIDPQLVVDRLNVGIDREMADDQLLRDLLIASSPREEV